MDIFLLGMDNRFSSVQKIENLLGASIEYLASGKESRVLGVCFLGELSSVIDWRVRRNTVFLAEEVVVHPVPWCTMYQSSS